MPVHLHWFVPTKYYTEFCRCVVLTECENLLKTPPECNSIRGVCIKES